MEYNCRYSFLVVCKTLIYNNITSQASLFQMYQMRCTAGGFELNVTVRTSPTQYSFSTDSGLSEMLLAASFTKEVASYFLKDSTIMPGMYHHRKCDSANFFSKFYTSKRKALHLEMITVCFCFVFIFQLSMTKSNLQ